MHINQTRNLPCPAPSPSVQTPPRPGPRYLPEPKPEPPSPRVPGGHRLEIHLTARARWPGPGPGGRRPQTKKPVRLGWARLGPGAGRDPPPPPGPQAGLGRAEGDSAGCAGRRGAAGKREGGARGGGRAGIYIFLLFPLPQPPLFSSPPFFPSFCYLDFFSCCVMSIIYAKSFAACCTARASRRGRRAGRAVEEGRGSGEPGKRRGGGGGGVGTLSPRSRREAPGALFPGWSGGSVGRVTQPPRRCRSRWFHFGRCERASRSLGVRSGHPMPHSLQSRVGAVTPSHRRLSCLVNCAPHRRKSSSGHSQTPGQNPSARPEGGSDGRSGSVEPPVGYAPAAFQGGDPGPECSLRLTPVAVGCGLYCLKTTSLPSYPNSHENVKKKKSSVEKKNNVVLCWW